MKQIRESKFSKIVAYYLIIMMVLQVTAPMQMYALTSGPTQPEFNSFTPIGTSDMVDLTSGDFNYNIPVMDVGGYPLNLAYNSGITMDQEASWVGLGWNLNVGEITRQVRGLPDDFKGDPMKYENDLRDNVTVGTNFNVSPALFGNDTPFTLGLGAQYNNYEGVTFQPSVGLSYNLGSNVQVGMNLTGSATQGATISPSITISGKLNDKTTGSIGLSAGWNSRKGLENTSISVSSANYEKNKNAYKKGRDKYDDTADHTGSHQSGGGSLGGSISFNSQSYTPTKRVAFKNTNKTFNATIGGEVFGLEGQVRISGYGSYQTIDPSFTNKTVGGYGYDNTHFKNGEGVLDFNREKEQQINRNTNALPITNYTYDIYNIEGQGVSGMFRPYRSQVGYLYNDDVSDFSDSGTFGVELGVGNLVHGGIDFKVSPSVSTTGKWANSNYAIPVFTEKSSDKNNPLYKPTTFKLVGELDVDYETATSGYINKMLGEKPSRIALDGGKYNRIALPVYQTKNNFGPSYTPSNISKIKRLGRVLTNQPLQKITNEEADDKFVFKNNNAKGHHTAGVKVLQADGTTYVYGKTVYNNTKVEATFDVSGKSQDATDIQKGLISYNGSVKGNHSSSSDRFVNKIVTPNYAHSYLITSVLSSDYEDIDNNGPSDKDLGGYTKFDYTKNEKDYRWRVPYEAGKVTYNEGLKTSRRDQKGNYIYGTKELVYLKQIETKTHIAFIDLMDRDDAIGVDGEIGGSGPESQKMKCIKSIRLYSKPELQKAGISFATAANVNNNIAVSPIKTAHFDYDYSLCKNTPNSIALTKGKLTLKRLYFTYRNSNMGKFTPYKFNYSLNNYDYNIKGFDIWGNYKNNDGVLSTSDFPFVEQNNETQAKAFTSAWTLDNIELPSGGKITIETESDDYQYVQNKKAMQMFMVKGAGESPNPSNQELTNGQLYNSWGRPNKYLYVKINNENISASEFSRRYLSQQLGKFIYFKFFLNMSSSGKEFVNGYFEIDGAPNVFPASGGTYAAIPVKYLNIDNSGSAHPISKTGWGFGRTNLNKSVYTDGGESPNTDFESIVKDLVGSIFSMINVFKKPNKLLQERNCARYFDNQRSWVRLENPDGRKFGGGLRVKSVKLSDEWDVMNNIENNSIYKEMYGQEYSYNLTNNTSSGVATFEPNASPENPFVEPFYGKEGNYAERVSAPKETNYIEKPFGENFFPSPRVTYSKVTVANLSKKLENPDPNKVIKKHATGKVVTENYTSYDFPTIVDYTNLDIRPDFNPKSIFKILGIKTIDHLTLSQGFYIETNDMNGKNKSQSVYAEGQSTPISKVVNNYNVGSNGRLNSTFTTIDEKGNVSPNTLGVTYDMINDFNENYSKTESFGVNTNLASFLAAIFPIFVPMPLPTYSRHITQLRTATTTKVVHKTGVLVEKVAYDLGSRVSTKNLAWDANTGQVLLTQTINEFDDKYYSFNYPAYWNYENMGMASKNIDLQGKLKANTSGLFDIDGYSLVSNEDISNYFKIADELVLGNGQKFWVNGYNTAKTHIELMNRDGEIITSSNLPTNLNFKVVRSGNRNQQMTSMASVTSMTNPIDLDDLGGLPDNITDNTFGYLTGSFGTQSKKVVNASAIEYSDYWRSQCENGLPNENGFIDGITTNTAVNPYIYNIKGDWRPIRSHAYLTGRNNFETNNRRKTGFFANFSPFYRLDNQTKKWSINNDKWTSASEITKYNPYGVELENKDALKRYSSAQYGYEYKLPVAVASNSMYNEMGFDGFEDYVSMSLASTLKPHFGFSQSINGETGDAVITNQKSHTGHNSIAIKANKRATFTRKIGGCKSDSIQRVVAKTMTKTTVKTAVKPSVKLSSKTVSNPKLKAIKK